MEKKVLWVVLILAGSIIIFGGYQYYALATEFKSERQRFASTTTEFEGKVAQLESNLTDADRENEDLREELDEQKDKLEEIEDQVKGAIKTATELEKLSKLDPELLQKYSKVYFLNEHYVPSGLKDIDEQYLFNGEKEMKIHSKVWSFLENLLEEAKEDGVDLKVISAFRSFDTQTSLKSQYKVTYGSGANQFSADQGYSEHQLGTTVDFTTTAVGPTFTGFEKTEAYQWLLDNAYRYGFILSYPAGNAYYIFEPWHWRFVGQDLARDLRRQKVNFYDLEQRVIDNYLLEIFD